MPQPDPRDSDIMFARIQRSGTRLLRYAALAGSLLLCVQTRAGAQSDETLGASAFLPSTHWAVAACRRLAELDLASADFGWGDGSLTRAAVGRVLHDAIAIAQSKRPALVPLAEGYWLRFQREFPTTTGQLLAKSGVHPSQWREGWAALGFAHATGRLYPVRSIDNSRDNILGPFARPDLSDLEVDANLAFTAGSHIAAAVEPERQDGRWSVHEGYVLATLGKVGFWAGRRAPAFGPGASGGIVLNGTAAFTGGGLVTTQPFRLPWVFRYVGSIRFENFLSRLDSNAAIRKPWFTTLHASVSPHPRVELGATESYMFGGEGVAPLTWNNVKAMFFTHGVQSAGTEFEDGIASFEVRVRPPVPLIPLTLYLEWGTEDNHAAWTLFPGRVIGAHVPAVPGLPALSLGVEYVSFSHPCTFNVADCQHQYYATWYRHYLFKDGWTLDRQPIGNPLGGEGSESLLYGTWDNPARRLRFDAQAFYAYRGQFNIYSPTHGGYSFGGEFSATYRVTPHMDFKLNARGEDGHTWHTSSLFSGFRWVY